MTAEDVLEHVINFARAIRGAAPPTAAVFLGIYVGTGYQAWELVLQPYVSWCGFCLVGLGFLWTLGIAAGRLTGWAPLVRLELGSPSPKGRSRSVTSAGRKKAAIPDGAS